MLSGRGRMQSAVGIVCLFIGLAEFQGHHINQAYYKSGITSPNIKGYPHLCTMNRCAVPICSIVTREGDFNHEANIVVWKPLHVI
jgi:hypothetical protein